jgi:thioredoxin 1
MSDIKHFDGPTFEADVLKAGEPVVVDFYADWCGPCRMMAPALEGLATELAGRVTVGKLDVDVNQDIAIRYGVMGIPTLGLFRNGELADRLVGYPGGSAPIRAWIEKNVPAATAKPSPNGTPAHLPAEPQPDPKAATSN